MSSGPPDSGRERPTKPTQPKPPPSKPSPKPSKLMAIFAAVLVGLGLGAVALPVPASASFFGYYNIKPYGTNKCLDVTGVSYQNGAKIQLYDCLGGTQYNQVVYFAVVNQAEYWYQIKFAHSGKCLDVEGGPYNTSYPVVLQQWDCLGPQQTNQVFRVQAGSPWYISPVNTGYGVWWQGIFNGANVFTWPGLNYQWNICEYC